MVSAFGKKETKIHKIPPEKTNRSNWLDIGTISCYFTYEDLLSISESLDKSRDQMVNTIFGEDMPDLVDYRELEDRVTRYIMSYEKRAKNNNKEEINE